MASVISSIGQVAYLSNQFYGLHFPIFKYQTYLFV